MPVGEWRLERAAGAPLRLLAPGQGGDVGDREALGRHVGGRHTVWVASEKDARRVLHMGNADRGPAPVVERQRRVVCGETAEPIDDGLRLRSRVLDGAGAVEDAEP